MKKPSRVDTRAKKIDRAIKLAYGSLESHLYWTHHVSKTLDKTWEKKYVKEYAELIKILSELY